LLLSDLIKINSDAGVKFEISGDYSNINIDGISSDSRMCQKNFLFAALPGGNADGRKFIESAIAKGAVAVLAPMGTEFTGDAMFIKTDEVRRALGFISAKFYSKQPENIIAVTGTNGKTSVAHFCRHIWSKLGKKSASIGTIGVIDEKEKLLPGSEGLTTPDPVRLHGFLSDLCNKGVTHLAMEASSHGLEQSRLAGVKIKAAGITNITRDHLDYHGTFEDYFTAKMRLFNDVLPKGGTAVLNADIKEFSDIFAICRTRSDNVITYGEKGGDIKLIQAKPSPSGIDIEIEVEGTIYKIKTALIGSFQSSNLLCAIGLVMAAGNEISEITEACDGIKAVTGRMEKVAEKNGVPIIVDYAHTPDALEKVLMALRPRTKANLVVVFGCGGDRDKGKRPIMGEIADRLADLVVVTDDNPRTENAETIRREIMSGCKNCEEIGDRARAIEYAIKNLKKGDLLVIAGKGHEDYQIIGDKKSHFSDAEEARKVVKLL